jgi:opine dehydrogenase
MAVSSVAVLGGGNGGHAIAADLSLAGFKVSFFELPQFVGESFREVMRRREVETIGGLGRGLPSCIELRPPSLRRWRALS